MIIIHNITGALLGDITPHTIRGFQHSQSFKNHHLNGKIAIFKDLFVSFQPNESASQGGKGTKFPLFFHPSSITI
jgi:hypothetical protein